MSQELSRRKIPHSGLQIEANATSLVLKLLTLPKPNEIYQYQQQEKQAQLDKIKTEKDKIADSKVGLHPTQVPVDNKQLLYTPVIDKDIWNSLMKRLLSVAVRSQINKTNQTRLWIMELVFYNTPLPSTQNKEQGKRRAVYLQYEMLQVDSIGKTMDFFLNDWIKIVYLYSLVHDFVDLYETDKYNFANQISIKSYSYTSLLILYGQNKEVSINIAWSNEAKEFLLVSSKSILFHCKLYKLFFYSDFHWWKHSDQCSFYDERSASIVSESQSQFSSDCSFAERNVSTTEFDC